MKNWCIKIGIITSDTCYIISIIIIVIFIVNIIIITSIIIIDVDVICFIEYFGII